jgi:mono/diheme cytochrome c family protein
MVLLSAVVAGLTFACKPADSTQDGRSKEPASAAAPPAVRPDTSSSDAVADREAEPADPMLARGKAAFRAGMCSKCHREDATGSARAPNLTDDEWVHCDGSIEGILGVLKSGVSEEEFVDPSRPFPMNPVTGLVPDEEDLKALATFVHSLSQR